MRKQRRIEIRRRKRLQALCKAEDKIGDHAEPSSAPRLIDSDDGEKTSRYVTKL